MYPGDEVRGGIQLERGPDMRLGEHEVFSKKNGAISRRRRLFSLLRREPADEIGQLIEVMRCDLDLEQLMLDALRDP